MGCLTGASTYLKNPYYKPPSPTVSAIINNAYKVGSAVIVSVTNTGSTSWTFYVGATAVKNSYCGSGCDLNACGNPYVDLPLQSITLNPGQTGTVTFNVGPAFQSLGVTVGWVIVKVWQYSYSNCLAGTTVWVNLY